MGELLGQSPGMHAVKDQLRRLLERQRAGQRLPPILLQGETGTGKNVVARFLHRHGARARGPFVDVNCAAIPDTLLEAELFGFEQGAFTDARRSKRGLFQAAHGGVLFLDEVALLPEPAQAKLLSAIENRAVRRLGSTRLEPTDVWLVSATNSDLKGSVGKRHFREDLYHRLAVLTIELPPLRTRGRDILLLAERFLARVSAEYGLQTKVLDQDAQARLLAYTWPGNIRQLSNVIERAALFVDSPLITAAALGPLEADATEAPAPDPVAGPARSRDAAIRQQLLAALDQTAWNISLTAARLGVARNTVYARIERFGLRPEALPTAPSGSRTLAHDLEPHPSSVGLHWEQRTIAMLRADVISRDTVDAWSLTSRALDAAIGKVRSFGGQLEELMPTGLVATFGFEAVEDGPRRAALAAFAIQRGAARTEGAADHVPSFAIGLHVAPMLIARVGAHVEVDSAAKRANWPVLEQLVIGRVPGETLLTAAAASFLDRRFGLLRSDRRIEHHGPTYRLVGPELHGLGLWGTLTPFVGRQEELGLLCTRLTIAGSGHGQVAAIVGEAGIGKSRLVFELTHSHLNGPWRVLAAGVVPYGDKASSYMPVAALLRNYFGIRDQDTHREIEERVSTRLLACNLPLDATRSPLLSLLDVPIEDRTWQNLTAPQRRTRTLAAVNNLLVRESRIQPLLVIFEDLGRADAETWALLDTLVDTVPTAAIALLVNYRPEYRHSWAGKSCYTEIHLDPLSASTADALLEALLGSDASLLPIKPLLAEQTGGNPLFIEEIVRALVETSVVVGDRGAYRLARPIDTIEVPPTVQAILAARIDHLPSDEKRLLEIAAVIGKDVAFPLLMSVAGGSEETLVQRLAGLQENEFLYQTRALPEREFSFKHPLTHEVTYASLEPTRRRALHGEIAKAIEQSYPGRLAEHVERLAHHTLHGELWVAAVQYLRAAGNKAAGRFALREAAVWFEQAADVLARLPADRATLEQAFDVRFELRHAIGSQGDLPRAVGYLQDAARIAEQLGDDRRLGRVYAFMVNGHNLLGETSKALNIGTRALQISDDLGDSELRLVTTTYLEQTHVFRGEFERAVELARTNLSAVPGAGDRRFGMAMPTAVFDRGWLVNSLVQLGRFAEAHEVSEAAIEISERARHPASIAWTYYNAGGIHLATGNWSAARPLYERAIDAIHEGQWLLQLPTTLACFARALEGLGDFPGALARAQETERLLDAKSAWPRAASAAVNLGHIYLRLGRLEDTFRMACRASENDTPAWHASTLHLHGELAAHPARWDPQGAKAHYGRALAMAEGCGMRPLAALCHLGLGALARRIGERTEAEAHLVIARATFRDMRMDFWLEEAERRLLSA